jgi:hypothetical protein
MKMPSTYKPSTYDAPRGHLTSLSTPREDGVDAMKNDLWVLWPDGDFCLLEEFVPSEWDWKTDDFTIVDAPTDDTGDPIFP